LKRGLSTSHESLQKRAWRDLLRGIILVPHWGEP
jgi:hypothetical protein